MATLAAPLLIFGGCCSNVYALEAILRNEPKSGLLITLTQFIFVTLVALPTQFSLSSSLFFLKKPEIPWSALIRSAALFFMVNMLNNWAFAFDISVPVHIILRSFGSVATMGAGFIMGKRYSFLQVVSVIMLTVGVLVAAFADAQSKGKKLDTGVKISSSSTEAGLAILLVAQFLSAYMGVYVQDMYAKHGSHWQENLFYQHLFSIPMFIPFQPTLKASYEHLLASPPTSSSFQSILPQPLIHILSHIPISIFHLLSNGATQCLCITGVNLLGSRSSAVTVTIVLNIRKLVSFMLSIWLFGNDLSSLMLTGAIIVFGSGALYGYESAMKKGMKTSKVASNASQEQMSKSESVTDKKEL